MEILEKEYHKTQRVLEKSRKAKDVEMLFTENDSLQNKLIAQEEQFREQNQALLLELANVSWFQFIQLKLHCVINFKTWFDLFPACFCQRKIRSCC